MFSEISRLRQRIAALESEVNFLAHSRADWVKEATLRRTLLLRRDKWAKAWKVAARKVNVWYRLAQHENTRLSEENARLRHVEVAARKMFPGNKTDVCDVEWCKSPSCALWAVLEEKTDD